MDPLHSPYPGAGAAPVATPASVEEDTNMERGGYDVFVRTWWRLNPSWPQGLEPCPGKRRYLARGVSYERARQLCQEYNSTHKPGRLSKKAEFTSA